MLHIHLKLSNAQDVNTPTTTVLLYKRNELTPPEKRARVWLAFKSQTGRANVF